jgi:glycosyltransferase involved in cell wall biosynthesis
VSEPENSLVIPVYRNAGSITPLLAAVEHIAGQVEGGFEAVFVIDGSPDDSKALILAALEQSPIAGVVVDHSRNFGAAAAVRTGMSVARGMRIATMAADLQEPPELVIRFLQRLASGEVDVVAGERLSRDDPGAFASKIYWRLYRRFVMADIPPDGVDAFACTAAVRDVICSLENVHTSLVAQLFWVGFRRELAPYDRLARAGKSGWTLGRKVRYLADSVFAFTDLPVKLLWGVGVFGLVAATIVAMLALIGRIIGTIDVPGYVGTILAVLFFGSLNMVGLGLIGSYVWRTYETTKGRPPAIVREVLHSPAGRRDGQ